METLEFIIFGGESKRFHTWPVLKEQRIDSHSFHVAMLCALMARGNDPRKGPSLTVPLLMAALTHDLAEHRMADLPAPVKRALPDYPEGSFRKVWGGMENALLAEHDMNWEPQLSTRELRWLKLADAMEGALYCIRERMMGNRYIDVPFHNFRSYIAEIQLQRLNGEEPTVLAIISYIDDMWEHANQ
jgi:5'-deoxynucleotidase YfbR-like HD superfamily hydrolase